MVAIVGGGVAGLVTRLILRWLLRRHYRRNKLIQGELAVTLLDEGVSTQTPNIQTRLEWDKIFQWRCNADYVLIYTAPKLCFVVPATVAAQGFDLDRLKAELTQHVGASA